MGEVGQGGTSWLGRVQPCVGAETTCLLKGSEAGASAFPQWRASQGHGSDGQRWPAEAKVASGAKGRLSPILGKPCHKT